MDFLKILGNKIEKIRIERNISQAELSELSGFTEEQISEFENGFVNMTIESAFRLSLGLGVPLNVLFKFSEDSKKELNKIKRSTTKTKPIVKWAGGKTQLLTEIKRLMPKKYCNYFEPFAGGCALLLNLSPKKAVINDFNTELIFAYKCFLKKKSFFRLIEILKEHEKKHSEEYFLYIRNLDRNSDFDKLSKEEIAARFLYLNKACFNGLYRVNSKGHFNVPSAKKIKIKIYDGANFKNLFKYFTENDLTILNTDFEEAVKNAKKGDFVYLDPPYDSYENKQTFTSYLKNSFGKKEQLRLRNLVDRLSEKGVNVMISNHNTPYINELYKKYKINIVLANRMINSKSDGRSKVEEVIITNY